MEHPENLGAIRREKNKWGAAEDDVRDGVPNYLLLGTQKWGKTLGPEEKETITTKGGLHNDNRTHKHFSKGSDEIYKATRKQIIKM